MSFPQGGDFVRDVSRDFSVVSADVKKDEGDGTLFSKPTPTSATFVNALADTASYLYDLYHQVNLAVGTHTPHAFGITKEGHAFLAKVLVSVSSSYNFVNVPAFASLFWRMAQFNPGDLPHWPGVTSELFALDVFSSSILHTKLTIFFLEVLAATFHMPLDPDMTNNIIQSDYYTTISGSDDICVGDRVPPFITLIDPTVSGIKLRPRNQIVDFSLTDEVTGVELSTVHAELTSTTTTGTIVLLDNGIDQTGGNVTVIGDPDTYRFIYTPPFQWEYNDKVVVTISGNDTVPLVDGNPFFCEDNETNVFQGDIPFNILNEEYLGATLTVVGDTSPPFLTSLSPSSGTVGNSVFSTVYITVADSLTGVDLSSLEVSVNNIPIVAEGLPLNEETQIGGTQSAYTITHAPSTAFPYGTTASITVVADDRALPAPNQLNTTYEFDFIGDSTLIIENFLPPVGTSKDLNTLDIEVDVRDDSYGVDADQTFFVINGTIISGTQSALASGIHLTYHPPNDFAFDEPIRVTVHGTNQNVVAPVVKEVFFTLFFGCRIQLLNSGPYAYGENVDVFVRARNNELLYRDLSTGYFFTSYTQPQDNLGASIFAINPVKDLPASLDAVGPQHRYGQTVTVEFTVEDYDGNILGPYTYIYTIEEKP